MSDTSFGIEKKVAEMLASRTPADRLRMASSMFDSGRKLLKAGIVHEKGILSEARLRAEMFMKLYGEFFTSEEIDRILSVLTNMQKDGGIAKW